MMPPDPELSPDEAVARFFIELKQELESNPVSGSANPVRYSPEEMEELHFRAAAQLLAHVCPDPSRCREQRCRRQAMCQHFAELKAMQEGPPPSQLSRRTPGALALRRAIWLFMNAQV